MSVQRAIQHATTRMNSALAARDSLGYTIWRGRLKWLRKKVHLYPNPHHVVVGELALGINPKYRSSLESLFQANLELFGLFSKFDRNAAKLWSEA